MVGLAGGRGNVLMDGWMDRMVDGWNGGSIERVKEG
jgi:hypothetical protein